MNEDQALSAFAALSGAARLRILRLLVQAGGAGLTAGDLSEAIEATPSRASFHLSTLSKAGLVTSEKVARHVTYKVDFKAMGGLVAYLLEDCCQNHPSVVACCKSDCS